MLASPARARRTARNFGFFARLVAPKVRMKSFGLKPSFRQAFIVWEAETAKELKVAGLSGFSPPPRSEPVSGPGVQLVGLSEKLGLSVLTSTLRRSSSAPPKTCGIGSEMAWTWAVLGS